MRNLLEEVKLQVLNCMNKILKITTSNTPHLRERFNSIIVGEIPVFPSNQNGPTPDSNSFD
jgi:hypothetical protein